MLSEMFKNLRAMVAMPLMAKLVMNWALPPEMVDTWFEKSRDRQYKRDLLFSSVFELMNLVAVKVFTTTHAAYEAEKVAIAVSVTSLYPSLKRNGHFREPRIENKGVTGNCFQNT